MRSINALHGLVLICLIPRLSLSQTTVHHSDFNTSQGSAFTTAGQIGSSNCYITRSGDDWGGRIDNGILELNNDAGASANQSGWVFSGIPVSSFTSPYQATLSSNGGIITWCFNMRQIRSDPAGFGSGNYGVAFVLGTTSTSAQSTGEGYAVILGESGTTDPLRLIKFANGLSGTRTTIISSNTSGLEDFGNEYLSIKVTFNPIDFQWELLVRNDGTSSFSDPSSGILTSQGKARDDTYAFVNLPYAGAYWQGSTTSSQNAFVDNFKVTVPVIKSEPANHVTDFQAVSNSTTSLIISFTTPTGSPTPDGYLIKGNTTGYSSIGAASDGNREADALLVKNILFGDEGVEFSGLTQGTTYYFKLWPYSNSGIYTDYLSSGTIPETTVSTPSEKQFRSKSSGSWTSLSTWETSTDGTTWTSATSLPGSVNDASILNGHTLEIPYTGDRCCKNLTVEAGARLWANNTSMTSPRYLSIFGNITCNGMVGKARDEDDAISFYLYGSAITISGSGSFTANRMYKPNGSSGVTNLLIAKDIQLRYNGNAIINYYSSASNALNTTISDTITLVCSGNGSTPSGGMEINGNDKVIVYGNLLANGVITNKAGVGGFILESNALNTAALLTSSSPAATVKRYVPVATTAINHFLSSPVTTANVNSLLDSDYGKYNAYKYDPSLGGNVNSRWIKAGGTEVMPPGKGFVIPYAHPSDTGKIISFEGTVSSGMVSTTISSSASDWNLVGNPYPASISPRAFLNENAKSNTRITSALYFWDESNSPSTSDYATCNLITSTKGNQGTGKAPDSIALGQGFFVQSAGGSDSITFKDDMKSAFSGRFFAFSDNAECYHFSLSGPDNSYNQIALAFLQDASKELDGMYDTRKLKGNSIMAFYSMVEQDTNHFVIQARPFFHQSDTIPLGLDIYKKGTFTFALDYSDKLSTCNYIYLHDSKLLKTIDLTHEIYKAELPKGAHKDRFSLILSKEALSCGIKTNEEADFSWELRGGEIKFFPPGNSDCFQYRIFTPEGKIIASGRGPASIMLPSPGIYFIQVSKPDSHFFKKTILLRAD